MPGEFMSSRCWSSVHSINFSAPGEVEEHRGSHHWSWVLKSPIRIDALGILAGSRILSIVLVEDPC